MNHEGEGWRPRDDARPYLHTEIEPPYLPTEIEPPYPPPADARPFLPTDIEPPYPPRYEGVAYQPTQTGIGEPGTAGPSYIPSHARPTGQPARPGGPVRHPSSPGTVLGFPPRRRPTPRTRPSASGALATLTSRLGGCADGAGWPAPRSP